MKSFFSSVVILSSLIFSGCNPKCMVSCGGTLYYVLVGFTRPELDSAVVTYFGPNNSNYSSVMPLSAWFYPSATDTTGDTLLLLASGLNDGLNGGLQLYLPSPNLTYKITNINIGNAYENQSCREGSPSPGFCSGPPYLVSYDLNGKKANYSGRSIGFDTTGYIYIHK